MNQLFQHRHIAFLAMIVCVFAWGPTAVVADDDIVTIKVEGRGLDKDGAVKDALRNAVEQGGKNEIMSKSKTKDFALEMDIVLTRATGIVKDYKILKEKESAGIVTVKIEAKVSKKLLDATWGDVKILLKQLGRPKIMVMFTEVIHDLDRPEGSREIVQRSSMLGTQIERKLRKLGFTIINAGQKKDIDKRKGEIAGAEDDVASLKALAMDYGAAIYIKGESRASGPQRTTAAGVNLNMWESDITLSGFWTETGETIFSNTLVGKRGGSRVAGPPGARQVLDKSGKQLANASVYDMLEAWSRGTAGGGGEIIVEIRNVANIKQSIKIKKALATLDGVEEVNRDGTKGTVKFTVVTNKTAENIIEAMVELTFEGFELEFEDQKMKTIICSVK